MFILNMRFGSAFKLCIWICYIGVHISLTYLHISPIIQLYLHPHEAQYCNSCNSALRSCSSHGGVVKLWTKYIVDWGMEKLVSMCTRGIALMNTGFQASGGNLYAGFVQVSCISCRYVLPYTHTIYSFLMCVDMLAHRILQKGKQIFIEKWA